MGTSTLERQVRAQRARRLSEAGKIVFVMLNEACEGDRRAQRALRAVATGEQNISEAITTSDFPGLFQQAVNAQVEAQYTATPTIWRNWAKPYLMKGLRKENFIDLLADFDNLPDEWSGVKTLPGGLPRIAEGTPYPAIGFTGGEKDVWTYKIGARLAFTWEAWDQDDWNMISQLPNAMVNRATRTEDLSATSVLVDENGFRASTWTGHMLAGNPALSWSSLGAALTQAGQMTDPDRVNTITRWALIVPRSLTPLAEAIVNTVQIEQTDASGNKLLVNNTTGNKVTVVENPFLGLLAPNAAYKDTMWMLVPFQGQGSDRTAIVQTFLRGKDTPELRIKNDTGNALGGGALDPYAGSFDSDDVQIRVRHFTNTVVLDSSIGFVASEGDGS